MTNKPSTSEISDGITAAVINAQSNSNTAEIETGNQAVTKYAIGNEIETTVEIQQAIDWEYERQDELSEQQETYNAECFLPKTVLERQIEEATHLSSGLAATDETMLGNVNGKQKLSSKENKTKSKIISFRVTEQQYEQIHFQCCNEYGELLMTVSELTKHSVLNLPKSQGSEQPLERYRLAIAAEMAMSVTKIVQQLDQKINSDDTTYELSENGKIINALDDIQNKMGILLARLAEPEIN